MSRQDNPPGRQRRHAGAWRRPRVACLCLGAATILFKTPREKKPGPSADATGFCRISEAVSRRKATGRIASKGVNGVSRRVRNGGMVATGQSRKTANESYVCVLVAGRGG